MSGDNVFPSETFVSGVVAGRICFANLLALTKLWCATSSLQTWLLSFLNASVAGEEAGFFEGAAESVVVFKEGAGNAVADCICLGA